MVFGAPHHPYTEALLSSVPQADGLERERIRLKGEIPSHADPPSGCVFHTRCPRARERCTVEVPPLYEFAEGHVAACHYPLNVTDDEVAGATKSPLSPLSSADGRPERVEDPEAPLRSGVAG